MTGGRGASRRMEGKVAVVTGSTQGLGEAIARQFVMEGAAGIVVTGRNADRGAAVVRSLSQAGTKAVFVAADLAEVGAPRKILEAADQQFGRVDSLVNAAAVTDRGTVLDTTPELYDFIMSVNVRAPFFLLQEAVRLMRRGGIHGTVVNIQSMSAHGGQPFLAPYSISKGALATMTRNAAFSLMPDRIRVNGLNIGWMNTPGEDAILRKYHNAQDGWLEEASRKQPFGRLVEPTEVARAVTYLASDDSGLMTGSVIDFDQSVLGCCESAPHPSKPV